MTRPRAASAGARPRPPRAGPTRLLAAVVAALLAGCAIHADDVRPEAPPSPAFKEAPADGATWLPAAPADALDRGPWWTLFGDPDLDRLAAEADRANPTVAEQLAAYRQAQALVDEARAAWFPALTGGFQVQRSDGRAIAGKTTGGAALQADWQPDLWGRVSLAVQGARAGAEAAADAIASARLSTQGQLATAYFSLREADAEAALLATTIEGYERNLTITRNRYAAGVAPKTDLLQAETQLANARADLAAVRAARARYEHAVAVLVGVAPGAFSLPVREWRSQSPGVPLALPSTLLQRRPDIAAAERQVAAANAQVGVERSAYFPLLDLTAGLTSDASRIADLFKVSNLVWAVGAQLTQTIFDAGARAARVEGARAARDADIARYRQTVLVAFQSVEDQLATLRGLAEQEVLRRLASDAADQAEQQIGNRYRAGQISYTEVVTAQVSALSARRALVQVQLSRQTATVALIQALGGGFDASAPPQLEGSAHAIERP